MNTSAFLRIFAAQPARVASLVLGATLPGPNIKADGSSANVNSPPAVREPLVVVVLDAFGNIVGDTLAAAGADVIAAVDVTGTGKYVAGAALSYSASVTASGGIALFTSTPLSFIGWYVESKGSKMWLRCRAKNH